MPPVENPPSTPPDTPHPGNGKSGRGGGDRNIIQGDVKYEKATNYGVQTGNIFGYNVIIGGINVALDAANNLTHRIQDFAARVEMVSLRLISVGEKAGATANLMNTINALVVKQARREGITDKDVTKEAKLPEVKDRDWGAGEGKEPESEVLSRKCFKDIMEAIRGAQCLFENVTKKIEDASDTLIRPQVLSRGGYQSGPEAMAQDDKVRLDEADKKRIFLTEKDIGYMETDIESRKTELNMMFMVFAFVVNDEKYEQTEQRRKTVERIVVDNWRLLKKLADRLLRDGGNPSPQPGLPDPVPLPPRPGPLPDMRPLQFPDLSRLTSLYMGWVIRKAQLPENPAVGLERSQKYSWAYAVVTRLTLSTEELFLKVLAQITQRASLGRTLRDDCVAVLESTSQKLVVDRLLRDQNDDLQRFHPQLEWTLGGLECQPSHVTAWSGPESGEKRKGRKRTVATDHGKRKTAAIEVILKTQWRTPWLGQPPRSSVGIGGPGPSGSVGPDPIHTGPRLWTNTGTDGTTQYRPNSEQQHKLPEPHTPHRPRARPRPHSELKKHRPVLVVREPKFVFLKEGGKKKAEKTGKARSKKKHQKHISIELRRPGSYYRRSRSPHDGSPGPSASFVQAPPARSLPPPPPPPPPGFRTAHVHIPPKQTDHERQREETEVIEELFEEFEELCEIKGKKKSKRPSRDPELKARRQEEVRKAAEAAVGSGFPPDVSLNPDSDTGITRRLMRQVERRSQQRMTLEQEHIENVKVDVVMGRPARYRRPPPPPAPIRIQTRGHPPFPPSAPLVTPFPRERARERHLGIPSPLEGRDGDSDGAWEYHRHQTRVEDVADYDDDDGGRGGLEETQDYHIRGAP
ncbi:hypothetical protein AUP68_07657 [Ilyonectria robusta]